MFGATAAETPPPEVDAAWGDAGWGESDWGESDWRAGFREHTDAPEPGYSPARVAPSGWLGLELDAGTADPGVLGDAGLVDAIIAFDHVGSWAAIQTPSPGRCSTTAAPPTAHPPRWPTSSGPGM